MQSAAPSPLGRGAARVGVLGPLQDDHCGAFAEHEAVATGVERPARPFRVLPALRERVAVGERCRDRRMQRRVGTTADDHVRFTFANQPEAVRDRLTTRRARGRDRRAVSAQAVLDRNARGCHVRQHSRREVRIDRDLAPLAAGDGLILVGLQAAAAARDDGAYPQWVDVLADDEARVRDRVTGRRQSEEDVAVDAGVDRRLQQVARVDRFRDSGEFDPAVHVVIRRGPDDPGKPVALAVERRRDAASDRRDGADAGDDCSGS
jgi:hypothetical protein